jgi:hypothetical protein
VSTTNRKAKCSAVLERTVKLLLLLLLIFPVKVSRAHEVEIVSSYVKDFLVTDNWVSELVYRNQIGEATTVRCETGYYDATQDEISGISRLNATAGWMKLGGTVTTLRNHLRIDGEAGVDFLSDHRIVPNGKASVGAAIPLPENPLIQNLRIRPFLWYTQRLLSAASLRNQITSWGYEGEATFTMILKKIDVGSSYRLENLRPRDTVLDSTFLDTLASGRPLLPIERNYVSSFYVYAVGKITSFLNAGYAFAWSNAKHDQWIATRREPYVIFTGMRPESGISYEYAYYPYPTPQNSTAHLLVVTVPVIIGPTTWRSKVAIPFYSSREQFSSPRKVPLGQEIYYNYYYTQKYTGPLTFESKVSWIINDGLTARLSYEYFCLPYLEWAYFTQNSYSYHNAAIGLDIEW